MNELKLPDQFSGSWDHCLILTFGANLPFFENSIWRQFHNHCPNKIILADRNQLLKGWKNCARDGTVRMLNQKYVADGISVPMSAHAKMILLTSQEKGRMLIGSGNLSLDGYASGGELFTEYEYNQENAESLVAFISAWRFIEEIIERNYTSPSVERFLRHLQENTPWLFRAAPNVWIPVRHNLSASFIEQLQEAVAGEPVDELWIHSPFYDEKAQALRSILSVFAPKQVKILVQAGRTSLDPVALEKVLTKSQVRWKVHTIRLKEEQHNTYIHAKLYLLKTRDRAICLQGSPNLSNAAMRLTAPQGNIELANLLIGNRNEFDYLFERLEIDPETPALTTLDVEYKHPEPDDTFDGAGWKLVGGEWQGDSLELRYEGSLPSLEGAYLQIGETRSAISLAAVNERILQLKISNDDQALLAGPLPVSIVWGQEDDWTGSNPIFVFNRSGLDQAMLATDGGGKEIESVGNLDLDDEEFERLLGELESALVFDRQSVWQMAGKTPPKITDEDDEASRLDYADIDYDQLRSHPKLRGYLTGKTQTDGSTYSRSRLQIILSSITGHFNGLIDLAFGQEIAETVAHALVEEESAAETEEEREEEELEKQKGKWSNKARISAALKHFVRRYLRGIKSKDFLELVGSDVMARNYVIFSHLLWRMYAKEWVEPEFVTNSLLKLWHFFWGTDETKGYVQLLDEDDRSQVLEFILECRNDGLIFAAIYHANSTCMRSKDDDRRLELRNFYRHLLIHELFNIEEQTLEAAWLLLGSIYAIDTPTPSKIAAQLSTLANFENLMTFMRGIEKRYELTEYSCKFVKQDVFREYYERSVTVDVLLINGSGENLTKDSFYEIIHRWENYHPRDYYRVMLGNKSKLFFYDLLGRSGYYLEPGQDEAEHIKSIPELPAQPWEAELKRMEALASQADGEISFDPAKIRENLVIEFM